MSIQGCLEAISGPCVKLIDAVQKGIGTLYEPHHKRKMADATAYEIEVIGDAMRNVSDMPVLYTKDGVAINSEDFNRIMKRAGKRLIFQEVTKQYNIESVIDNAYEILEKEETCSAEPVSQGWINRFFDSVADISDEDLQMLWGKILAGEIKQPKTYSLRTLETLKNLSKHEADLFISFVPYLLWCKAGVAANYDDYFLSFQFFEKSGNISFSDISLLIDAGLFTYDVSVEFGVVIQPKEKEYIYGKSKKFLFENLSETEISMMFHGFALTNAGREILLSISDNTEPEDDFYQKCLDGFFEEIKSPLKYVNKDKVRISIIDIKEKE